MEDEFSDHQQFISGHQPTCRSIGLKPQTDLQKYTYKITLFCLAIKGQKYVKCL